MLLTIGAAVLLLGVVVFIHELGHFLAAKAVGIGVPRFSLGFGNPTPLRFRAGETEYVVSWLPLGGYVKMATREEEEAGFSALEGGEGADFPDHKLFENKPLWARILVLSAGVIMNIVLAWGIYAGLTAVFGEAENPVTTIAAVDDSLLPAAAQGLADLPFGTKILRINGDTVASWEDISDAIVSPSHALRFEFAGRPPITVPIPIGDMEGRAHLFDALEPLIQPKIGEVLAGHPAARGGLASGDLVVRVNGDTIRTWAEFVRIIEASAGDTLQVSVLRAGAVVPLVIVPEAGPKLDPVTGKTRTVGQIGVGRLLETLHVEYGLLGSIGQGAQQAFDNLREVVLLLKALVTGQVSPRSLGGPLLIGQLSGEAARFGLPSFLGFMAFISINLAVFNLLPIPVLDGGQLVFLLWEGVRGKPAPLSVRLRFTQAGLALLFVLVIFVVFNDVARILGQ